MHTFASWLEWSCIYRFCHPTVFGNYFPMLLNILRKYFYQLLNIPLCIIELFIDFWSFWIFSGSIRDWSSGLGTDKEKGKVWEIRPYSKWHMGKTFSVSVLSYHPYAKTRGESLGKALSSAMSCRLFALVWSFWMTATNLATSVLMGRRQFSVDTDACSVPTGLRYCLLTRPQRSKRAGRLRGTEFALSGA